MTLKDFAVFFLVLTRVAGFMTASPLFSVRGIPNLVKVGLALILSGLLLPAAGTAQTAGTLVAYALQVSVEALIGLALGFAATLIFMALRMGGQLIDFQGCVNVQTFH